MVVVLGEVVEDAKILGFLAPIDEVPGPLLSEREPVDECNEEEAGRERAEEDDDDEEVARLAKASTEDDEDDEVDLGRVEEDNKAERSELPEALFEVVVLTGV